MKKISVMAIAYGNKYTVKLGEYIDKVKLYKTFELADKKAKDFCKLYREGYAYINNR